ncbi:MAG TPA: hypothetical protein VN258_05075 [Mobilitalea sp.]|nr:hypothetical protein [Mobilitalea sp.]
MKKLKPAPITTKELSEVIKVIKPMEPVQKQDILAAIEQIKTNPITK